MTRPLLAALAVAAAAVVVAGCGSSNSSSGSSTGGSGSKPSSSSAGSQSTSTGSRYSYGSTKAAAPSSGTTALSTRHVSAGTALVASGGRTVYLFEKDKGPASSCSGACAKAWPPLAAGSVPKAGAGVTASMLALIKRPDGTQQVAYNGHPLYFFVGDKKPGQDAGQGLKAFGADWYVVAPSGSKIDHG